MAEPSESVFSDDDEEEGLVPAVPAATLILFHEEEGVAQSPRILMVRRAKSMAFAAGAAVFPGGRVDADDYALATQLASRFGHELADAAARIAAIRETLEETGLAIGLEHAGGAAELAAMRRALLGGVGLSHVLEQHSARLTLSALTPFSRWRPNFTHSRVFDTRFYIARTIGPLPDHDVDGHENSELFWIRAQDAVARARDGQLHMIFPTRRNLERLAQYDDFAAAHGSTHIFPSRRITPFIVDRDGEKHLCIRDDCGYPVTSELLDNAMRD
ncbi:MAG: NUDIX domain-containing protein [Sphingopyxis sp.]